MTGNCAIRQLIIGDMADVMQLYVRCTPGPEPVMRETMGPVLMQLVSEGHSYGVYAGDVLAGMAICFDYTGLAKCPDGLFRRVFYDGDVLPYAGALHGQLQVAGLEHDVWYILALVVAPEFRQQGLASMLLEHLVFNSSGKYLVTAFSDMIYMPVFMKHGFSRYDVDDSFVSVRRVC